MRRLIALCLLLASPAFGQRTVGPSADTGKVYGNYIRAPHSKGSHTLDNLLIKDVSKTCSDDCIEIEDGSGPVTVEGGVWHHVGSPEKISAVFTNQNGNLITTNVKVTGSYDPSVKPKADFPNTDGIMSAQRTFLTVNGGTFSNFWDSGIDTKATTTLTGTVTVENSRVSLKVWGPLVGDTLVSKNPRDGHIAALQSPVVTGNVHLKKLVAYDSDPNGLLFSFQGNGGVIQVDECELHVPPTMRVSWIKPGSKDTKLILGPTCVKDGKVVVASDKQIVNAGQLLPDNDKDGLIQIGYDWAKKLNLKTNTLLRHLTGFDYEVVTK